MSVSPAFGQDGKAKKTKTAPEPKWVELIDPKTFPQGWVHQSGRGGTPLKETWRIDVSDKVNPWIVCTGKPTGYLRTVATYEEFELSLEWKYLNDAGNSGILLNIAGKDKIWPAAIQVQLHRPTVGSIIRTPDPGSKLPGNRTINEVKLAVGQWHKCTIVSREGKITVSINGKEVNYVKDFAPKKGHIGLQSEESEIHFRHIKIRDLKPEAAASMVKSKKKSSPKKPGSKKKPKSPTS